MLEDAHATCTSLKEWHVLILPLHVMYLDAKAHTSWQLMTLAVAVQQH